MPASKVLIYNMLYLLPKRTICDIRYFIYIDVFERKIKQVLYGGYALGQSLL